MLNYIFFFINCLIPADHKGVEGLNLQMRDSDKDKWEGEGKKSLVFR